MIGIGLGIAFDDAPPIWTPAQLVSPRFVGRWDQGFTPGATTTWADQSGQGNTLSQGSAAAQPALGASFLSFDGGDRLAAAVAATWNFMHDGTGMCFGIRYRATHAGSGVLLSTAANNVPSTLGMSINHDNTLNRILWGCGTGAAIVINRGDGGGTAPANTDLTLVGWYQEGLAGAEYNLRINGVSPYSGNSTAAPSASTASAFTVGATAGATVPMTGRIYRMSISASVPSAADLAKLETWLAA